MQMRNPTFEVRPSVITGDTADVYLHRTQRILRNEGLNPTVSMQFSASREAVISGSLEVKALIGKVTSEGNRELWAVEEGSHVGQNEVCLEIKAPYSSFGLYETAVCGVLAHQTGWATAARDLVKTAERRPRRLAGRAQRAPVGRRGHGLRCRRRGVRLRFHGAGSPNSRERRPLPRSPARSCN